MARVWQLCLGASIPIVAAAGGSNGACDQALPEFDFYAGEAGARRLQAAQGTDECQAHLSAEELSSVEQSVSGNSVVVFGLQNAACTVAAQGALQSRDVCFENVPFDAASPLWSYFQCLYPLETVGANPMHSYVFVGGEFVGNGFRLLLDDGDSRCATGSGMPCLSASDLEAQLSAASAELTCARDCSAERGLLSQAALENLDSAVGGMAIVLYGWQSCPCTDIARRRFMSRGACYAENVWAETNSAMMGYLNCVHGPEHHSFVWIGGQFVGNGFAFADTAMTDTDFDEMLETANTVFSCQLDTDVNLLGEELQSCTQDNDGTTTGWTRTGSCVWDPSDGGYHQVCVTMTQEFLDSSATNDANDLSSVTSVGGHWCICAWAWASAVQRDPDSYQGITLDCERTNGRLRDVYDLHIEEDRTLQSPSGAHYQAQAALDAVEAVCAGVGAPTRDEDPVAVVPSSGGSGSFSPSVPDEAEEDAAMSSSEAEEEAEEDTVAASSGGSGSFSPTVADSPVEIDETEGDAVESQTSVAEVPAAPVQVVRGALSLSLVDPAAFIEDAGTEAAVKDAVAVMAGAGVSSADVTVTITLSNAGRRLRDDGRSLQGSVLVEYEVVVADANVATELATSMAAVETADMTAEINRSLGEQGVGGSVTGVEVVLAAEATVRSEDSTNTGNSEGAGDASNAMPRTSKGHRSRDALALCVFAFGLL